jgi:rubrerythrin
VRAAVSPLDRHASPTAPLRLTPTAIDRLLWPLHRWVWLDAHRRGKKLLRFAETEAAGGRDLSRAAELSSDGLLRRLYLRHSEDEHRHAALFRRRAREILSAHRHGSSAVEANWLAPGERGFENLRVEAQPADALLAFLHLSEGAAARRFALYQKLLDGDPSTRDLFGEILKDEAFHMSYTRSQLARIAPKKQGFVLWRSRAGRVWKAYLRIAGAIASLFGTVFLTAQYFLVLPLFAYLAKRNVDPEGFSPPRSKNRLESQY